MKHNSKKHEFELSVIISREDPDWREDRMWTALALEMDMRGYGPTQHDALNDLLQMLAAQVSFAVQMGHPESVWHPAEQKYWDMYQQARKNGFVAELSGSAGPTDQIADLVPLSLLASKQGDGWTGTGA